MELKSCPECGVPELITSEHLWLNNGDIVHARAVTSRMLFIETENMDPLFKGIAEIIGTDIEPMVITAARRAYRLYLEAFVPEKTRQRIRKKELDYDLIDAAFRDLGRLNGSGSYNRVEKRYEQDKDDFDTVSITEPNSIPLTVAAHLGAVECLTGVDQGYRYTEVSPDTYHITSFPSPHPKELSERMWFEPYSHREGDMELERCATCGGPKMLAGYQWYPSRGIVVSKTTRRRMAVLGDALIGPVFSELEAELGETIPTVVVEAQRRFTRSGFYTMEDITDEGDFRTQLAMRGLGNLKQLEMKRKGMSMRLDNAALPLITIGLSQGFFEMGFDIDTNVEWELSEGGDLSVEVTPMKHSGSKDPTHSMSG
jgi:hypothetical protein